MTANADPLSQNEADRLIAMGQKATDERWEAHDREHTSHDRDHEQMHERLDVAVNALRDVLKERFGGLEALLTERMTGHNERHKQQQVAVEAALEAVVAKSVAHAEMHDKGHVAHAEIHENEQTAVKTALSAVAREREIHSTAHEREHTAHGHVHTLAQLAVDKAEKSIEERLHTLNDAKTSQRDLQSTFITRDLADEKYAEKEKRMEQLRQDIDRRFAEQAGRITDIEKSDVKGEGRSLGQGATIAAIVGSVTAASAILGLVIVVANILTGGAT